MNTKHTPGPWAWFGNRSSGVYLATTHSGRKYVMGFKRYGMNGAQPMFRCNDRMVPAAELVEFQVGEGTARGFKQAASDGSVYRYDVSGIDNADARLIAAAPDLLDALLTILGPLKVAHNNSNVRDDECLPVDMTMGELRQAWAAIAKATGQEGGAL